MDFPSGNGVVRGRRGQQLEFALITCVVVPLAVGAARGRAPTRIDTNMTVARLS